MHVNDEKKWNIGNITKKIICLAERDSFIFLEPTYVKELKKLLNKWLYSFLKNYFVLEIFKFRS